MPWNLQNVTIMKYKEHYALNLLLNILEERKKKTKQM